MPNDSRRAFLRTAIAASLAAPAAAAKSGHLQFPTAPRQRLAVTSYPFRAYIESPTNPARDKSKPGMDLTEFPAMIAKRFAVRNINPLGYHLRSTDPAYLAQFRKAVEAADSHVVGLGLSGRDFASSAKSDRDDAVAYGQKWIDIAALIGSPSVRQHLRIERGAVPSTMNAAESLARLADYGSKKNVVVNLENDSPEAEDPFFIVEVLSRVNSPYLRALPDFGNSLAGHDAAYNQKAMNAMFPYAWNMSHVKEILQTKTKEFRVDVSKIFSLARAHSYRGYFSMECDSGAGDPFQGTQHLIDVSMKYM